jgi:rapamycin-insensitive companion of mTOR
MLVLESHHFHHQMWCFTLNLFDKRVMRRIVLDEVEDDDDSERASSARDAHDLEDSDEEVDNDDDDDGDDD